MRTVLIQSLSTPSPRPVQPIDVALGVNRSSTILTGAWWTPSELKVTASKLVNAVNLLRRLTVGRGHHNVNPSGRFGQIKLVLSLTTAPQFHDDRVALDDPADVAIRAARLATNSPGGQPPDTLQPFLISSCRFLNHFRCRCWS